MLAGKEMIKLRKNKTVFVGVSGGVDSAVALAILKRKGYAVVGVFIKTWSPEFINCPWPEERREAIRVCANLGVPFLDCDATEEYKKEVAFYMINEYEKGRTPNPDVMCNREIKFGVFWKFAKERGADFIATGHYAKKVKRKDGSLDLLTGPDENKDQIYFLWTLNQDDLSHTFFPVGNFGKRKVRRLAKKYRLPNATKKDSQGVCFLGPLDMKKFLAHYITEKEGDVLDEQGEIVGKHRGAVFFTLGERHGFVLDDKHQSKDSLYVIAKNMKDNTITVSNNAKPKKEEENHIIKIDNCNWINKIPKIEKKYKAQVRYHGELYDCSISSLKEREAILLFDNIVLVDKGQSIIIYEKETCLGGGVII
jgi:tRNA-specific 2-thiouridylase